jgi:hypothetical protein
MDIDKASVAIPSHGGHFYFISFAYLDNFPGQMTNKTGFPLLVFQEEDWKF